MFCQQYSTFHSYCTSYPNCNTIFQDLVLCKPRYSTFQHIAFSNKADPSFLQLPSFSLQHKAFFLLFSILRQSCARIHSYIHTVSLPFKISVVMFTIINNIVFISFCFHSSAWCTFVAELNTL